MGDDPKWKRRLPSRIYNYNYKVSEGYYKPQTDYLKDKNFKSRTSISPPKHQSYAERFSNSPWYGSTRGLPYSEQQAAGPLLKLSDRQWRTSSLLREMKELEDEGIPLNLRASRRKKRYEEEDELASYRKRANRNYLTEEEKPTSRSKEMIAKDFHYQVKQKINSLDEQLRKSTQQAAVFDTPSWNYDLDHPKRQVKNNVSDYYSSPNSKYSLDKYSRADVSTQSSITKPPVIPFRSRKYSCGNTEDSNMQSVINSIGDFTQLPSRTSRRSSETEEELSLYSNRAPRLREARRHREAQDFSDDICKKVDMMRVKNIEVDPLVVYSHNRNPRASSLDRIPRRRSHNTSRYVYGIGKI